MGTHDWNKFLTPEEIELMLDQAGMGTKIVNGMLYVPGKSIKAIYRFISPKLLPKL